MAVKLLLVFVEYNESNTLLLLQAIDKVDSKQGMTFLLPTCITVSPSSVPVCVRKLFTKVQASLLSVRSVPLSGAQQRQLVSRGCNCDTITTHALSCLLVFLFELCQVGQVSRNSMSFDD